MISVIIPTYNREKTIKRAIESVLNQSYKDIEVIVVDDCSTDNTSKVVKKIKDDRLRYIKLEKNSGACRARNVGVSEANGEYIAFQDSDDEWLSNKLEIQLNNLLESNSDVDFCYFIRIDGDLRELLPAKREINRIKKHGIKKALRFGNVISTQLLLGKAECFKNNLFEENLPRLQDFDLVLRLSEQYNISITREHLVNIYVQSDSISKSNEKFIRAVDIIKDKEYEYKSILLSSLYKDLGNISTKNKRKYYFKALKYRFSLKLLIKLILGF